MLKKTITYTDYNDNVRTETFYFNLNKAELADMEYSESGGLSKLIEKITETQDHPTIMRIFKMLLLRAYGEKSPDGKRFVKSEEISKAFSETEAYVQLYMELATDAKAAADFFADLMPKDSEKKEIADK